MASVGPSRASSQWLHGPLPDVLLGCGMWYAAALALLAWTGPDLRAATALTALPFLATLFGTPHYGATLLRVYERRDDRQAYAIFAVWVTLAMAAAFVASVYHGLVGSILLTLYLTWSPWHYTGQNYGIAVMFLRRRGVALDPGTKRALYASFLLSFALTFLVQHAGASAQYAPLDYSSSSVYRFLPLGIPYGEPAIAAVGAAYLAALGAAAWRLGRRASATALLPAALLVLIQALWFSVPLAMRQWQLAQGIEPWSTRFDEYYFLWIAIGHSVQYLWITSYYERSRAGGSWSGLTPYLGKALLAGAALWALPALLFAPNLLGRLPYDSGLAILVAAVVNLHHFVLDGAIWKLRDGRVARILVRPRPEGGAVEPRDRGWRAPAVWIGGAVCAVALLGGQLEQNAGVQGALERGDLPRAQRALERLKWIGRDSARAHRILGDAFAEQGRLAVARAEYERALEVRSDSATWHALGLLNERTGRWHDAVEAHEQAVALQPTSDLAHHALGRALLEVGKAERARDAFARAAELNPDREIHRVMVERASAQLGSPTAAAH